MMASKKEPGAKKKPVTVHIAFPPDVIELVDQRAEVESRTRVNMIQVLVKQALEEQSQTA